MADTGDLKSPALKSVWVRVPPSAQPCIPMGTRFFDEREQNPSKGAESLIQSLFASLQACDLSCLRMRQYGNSPCSGSMRAWRGIYLPPALLRGPFECICPIHFCRRREGNQRALLSTKGNHVKHNGFARFRLYAGNGLW